MNYSFYLDKNNTPQTEAIPGRESEMVKGASGAVAFKADLWQQLRRCLIMGTATGSYYTGAKELTDDFVQTLKSAIAEDPRKVADEVLYASDGHAINNHAPIFALVLLSMGESHEAKQAFKEIHPKVVRTASHFYEWVSYTKSMRGMGRVIQDVGKAWLQRDDVKWLCYQFLKYQSRYEYSARDVLRLFKPKAFSSEHSKLFGMITGRKFWNPLLNLESSYSLNQWGWTDWLKRNPNQGSRAVREGKLTHEMVTGICTMDRDVWQALFETMPIGAMLRNLGSLTEIGVLRLGALDNIERVEKTLLSQLNLRKGRIHPIDILKALKTYQSNGKLGKSRKTWNAIAPIVDILEEALNLSFDTLEPTNKVFLHAVDVSGSMGYHSLPNLGLTCAEIAATMALATAKAEKYYYIHGFSNTFADLGITKKDSFTSACNKAFRMNFGATDASVAYDWAIQKKAHVDVFCFWTDGETWAGRRHPSQALADYRRRVNPDAKAVYTTLQASRLSLGDPNDSNSFDFAGFDPSVPKAIQMIAKGEI